MAHITVEIREEQQTTVASAGEAKRPLLLPRGRLTVLYTDPTLNTSYNIAAISLACSGAEIFLKMNAQKTPSVCVCGTIVCYFRDVSQIT